MSGPWDRPPAPSNAGSPSDDVGPERRDSDARGGDPDAWESQGPSLWDDSPSGVAPPYDYEIDETILPSSDPWAESWTDESASQQTDEPAIPQTDEPANDARRVAASPEPPPVRWEPDADVAAEPASEGTRWTAPEPPSNGSSPAADSDAGAPPLSDEGWAAAASAPPPPETALPSSAPETADEAAPRAAPWTPGDADADFWAYEAERPAAPPSDAAPRPAADEQPSGGPVAEEAAAPAPSVPHASPWQPDSDPDWLVEPLPIGVSEPEPQPHAEPAAEPEAQLAAAPSAEPPTAPPPAPTGSIFPQPASEPVTQPDTAPAVEAVAAPQLKAAPEPAAEPEAVAEPEAGPAAETPVEAAEAAVELPDAHAAEAVAPEAEAEPDAAAPAPETDESSWRDRIPEPTQVLPSSWTPPPPAARDQSGPLVPTAGSVRTSLAASEAEAEDLEATTAEQAVPWLIGVILLLGGMVIVLLALIFAGEGSLSASAPTPSAEGAGPLLGAGDDTPSPTGTPVERSTPTPAPTETPPAGPQYGPLEVVYQGRSMASAPIYLLHRDFTQPLDTTVVLAQDDSVDVRRFAWAPDGTRGAALLAEILVSVEPGEEKRQLGTDIDTITFGADANTVYAAQVTQNAAEDVAVVLAIDFASGDATELASISYARPVIAEEPDLQEAQFADEGGTVRLYWMEDETLRLWILGGGTWDIDPDGGEPVEVEDAIPTLWAPDGERRIDTSVSEGVTTLAVVDEAGEAGETTTVEGLVSHLRWSPDGRRVIFTVGRQAAGGGILQDLFLWDLDGDEPPEQLTPEGAAFGVEWLGAQPLWRD